MRPLFTDANQIAIVVRDLEATMKTYVDGYGIGPWAVYECNARTMTGVVRHGQPAEHAFRIALASIGNVGWELIQPLDDVSVYAEFLREHGEGVHHVALEVPDLDSAVDALEAKGRRVLQGGVIDGITHRYMSTDEDLGVIAEIYDWPADAKLRPPESTYP